jgi:hypothetical protein
MSLKVMRLRVGTRHGPRRDSLVTLRDLGHLWCMILECDTGAVILIVEISMSADLRNLGLVFLRWHLSVEDGLYPDRWLLIPWVADVYLVPREDDFDCRHHLHSLCVLGMSVLLPIKDLIIHDSSVIGCSLGVKLQVNNLSAFGV